MTDKEIVLGIKRIKQAHPTISSISVQFEGSGDSFSDFYNHNVLTWSAGTFSTFEGGLSAINVDGFDIGDLFWKIIEEDGRADFNNEGSRGSINIDFKEGVIKINVEVPETIWEELGEEEINFKPDYGIIKTEKSLSDLRKVKKAK